MNVLDQYEQVLRQEEDLAAATIRNYLSDLRQFAHGVKFTGAMARGQTPFRPERVATPTITDIGPTCNRRSISNQPR